MLNILPKKIGSLVAAIYLVFLLAFAGTAAAQLVSTVGGGSPVLDSVQAQVAAPTVDVSLLVSPDVVNENDTFVVLVTFDPSHFVEVGAFQWYLNYDPTTLQCVSSTPTNDVEPGAPFGSGRFKDVLQNSCDNVLGQVDFAGGTGILGRPTVVPFVSAAVRFEAIAADPGTIISLGTVAPRQTKVLVGLTDVTGTLTSLSIEIIGAPPLSDMGDLFNIIP